METRPVPAASYVETAERATSTDATLVAGTTFCASEASGDIGPGDAHGFFVEDTRIVSTWRLRVDGEPVDPLTVIYAEPFEATFVGRAAPRPDRTDPTLVVERRRLVGTGLREDVTLRNFSPEAAGVRIRLEVDADFADLFEVKSRRRGRAERVARQAIGDSLVLSVERAGARRGLRVTAADAEASVAGLSLRAVVPAHGSWTTTIEVRPSPEDDAPDVADRVDVRAEPEPAARRMQRWRAAAAEISTGNRTLHATLARTERDLGALRIVDPAYPDDDVVAAGAPWFMALFGRDALVTSWMALPFAPSLALGTLRTLARLQGRRADPMTEEEPGKILHEVRLGMDHALALGGESVYFGSVDATPLFVVVVDRALRWGSPVEGIRALLPAVDAALAWILEHGDHDGDGFVEYRRRTDRGLANQGWKDSHDAIAFADGTFATPPVALAEVQGYAYAAFLARAHLADVLEDGRAAAGWRTRAAELRQAFDATFWLPDRGWYALALDRDKRPVDVLSSNVGHCLWSGIVPDRRAPQLADALLSPAMFTGFGLRTLGTGSATYNPVSYHNGSVWPHDTTLAISGLGRYGLADHAGRLLDGLLRVARSYRGRLPELFCGFDETDKPAPVPYPTSCSPQAWAAASPYELVRAALGLDVCVPHGEVHARPAPDLVGDVHVTGLPIGEHRVALDASASEVTIEGLPSTLAFHADGRPTRCGSLA